MKHHHMENPRNSCNLSSCIKENENLPIKTVNLVTDTGCVFQQKNLGAIHGAYEHFVITIKGTVRHQQ